MSEVFEPALIQTRQHCGPLSIREIQFEAKGQVLPGHRHNFDHVTMVVLGLVRVVFSELSGGVREETFWEETFEAPQYFNVPALTGHEITSLSDQAIVRCVFPIRARDCSIPDQVTAEDREGLYYDNREHQGDVPPKPNVRVEA